jgi:hypothetical protein
VAVGKLVIVDVAVEVGSTRVKVGVGGLTVFVRVAVEVIVDVAVDVAVLVEVGGITVGVEVDVGVLKGVWV